MRLRRILLGAIAAALLAAPSAQAWVRKESDRWVWYVPNARWVDSQGQNGIDLTSPTGHLFVGHGFGPTPYAITHDEAVDIAVQNSGLDPHPLRSVRLSAAGGPTTHEGVVRRVYKWRGYRTDRKERVRGVLTVDVMNDDATFTYGYSLYARTAPLSLFKRWDRKLLFMQRNIRLQPSTPEWGF